MSPTTLGLDPCNGPLAFIGQYPDPGAARLARLARPARVVIDRDLTTADDSFAALAWLLRPP